jgi:hypothetical protein
MGNAYSPTSSKRAGSFFTLADITLITLPLQSNPDHIYNETISPIFTTAVKSANYNTAIRTLVLKKYKPTT